MARGPLGARVFSLLLLLFSLKVVAGVGGPADLFLFLLLRDCWRSVILVAHLERIENELL